MQIKYLLIQKKTIAVLFSLLFLHFFAVSAAEGQDIGAIKDKVTVSFARTSLDEVFVVLDRQTTYTFSYDRHLAAQVSLNNLNYKKVALGQVLKSLGTEATLKYDLDGSNISIRIEPAVKPAPRSNQQPGRISGKVVDENGESLPGASIRLVELNRGMQTNVDGSFQFGLDAGTYTIEVSFISYQTQRITGVVVRSGDVTGLTISMKPSSKALQEIVVSSDYRKASIEGLLARQKNAAAITNGISSEQIARMPDNNVGQVLKRISGVATFDNKYVIVRGISERYNVATLDGTPLPSTDMSRRNFNFDLIPSEMIDNVTVSKTVTPDMTSGFGGGLVTVNTKDIPDQNFMSFSAGLGYNDRATGKDFLSTTRGKYDYLGFDDKHRNFPEGVAVTDGNPGKKPFTDDRTAQSRKFTNNYPVYRYTAIPNQNYSFNIGRVYNIGSNNAKFGFIGTLSYRNTQGNSEVINQRPSFVSNEPGKYSGEGNTYNFNTTWGGLLNLSVKVDKHQFSIRNMYTRIFNNPFYNLLIYSEDGNQDFSLPPDKSRYTNEPDFMNLLQNKVTGKHQLGKTILNWDVARTSISHDMKDHLRRQMEILAPTYPDSYHEQYVNDPGLYPLSRSNFSLNETDYNWQISASRTLAKGSFSSMLKLGYFGFNKEQRFDWVTALLRAVNSGTFPEDLKLLPLEVLYRPENFGKLFNYQVNANSYDYYNGKNKFHAGYAMVDQKLFENIRINGGLKIEYFDLSLLNNPANEQSTFIAPGYTLVSNSRIDKKWQFLPSTNLTWSLTTQTNFRASYSQSMVRPEFNERALFARPDPVLGANIQGQSVTSTKFSNYDLRFEHYSKPGEVLSVGLFYKYIDSPLELEKRTESLYIYSNSFWAKNYGLEAEVRKQLDFVRPASKFWGRLTAFGNATFIKSEVQTSFIPAKNYRIVDPVLKLVEAMPVQRKDKRPLYGQTPVLANAGISYDGVQFGLNLVYNYTGRKFYSVGENIAESEFESPLGRLDLQLNYAVLNKKGMFRLNMANLLDNNNIFYTNGGYTQKSEQDKGNVVVGGRPPGYSDNFNINEGDYLTYSQRTGRTFSLSFSYSIR